MIFFSKIFKIKKTIFFVLLSVIAIGIIIPGMAYADCEGHWYTKYCTCNAGACVSCWTWPFCGRDASGVIKGSSGDCTKDSDCTLNAAGEVTLTSGPDNAGDIDYNWNPFKALMIGGTRLILWACWAIADWSARVFGLSLKITTDVSITHDKLFTPGWTSVRDLANMLIVLGFVIVGIATSLRIREYEAKKLLFPLIAVALLVNFSGLFCGLIIDAANIMAKTFTPGTAILGANIVDNLAAAGRLNLTSGYGTKQTYSFMMDCLLYCIFYIVIAFTFIYISILLIARYAILAMLFILSPLAFAFWVFPASKKLWTDWWSHFLRWAFMGVLACFFLGIAQSLIPQKASIGDIQLIVGLVFIIVGVKITSKSSGLASMASGAIVGLATGAAGFAMGAVKATSGAMLEKTGRTNVGRRVREGLSSAGARISEATGFAKEGHHAQWQAGKRSEAEKEFEAKRQAPPGSGDRNSYEQAVKHGTGIRGAGAVATSNKYGEFGKIMGNNLNTMSARAAYATQVGGYQKSDFSKSNPNIAGSSKEIREATAKVAPAKATEWHPDVVTPEVYNGLSRNQIKEIGLRGSPELVDKIKAYQWAQGVDPNKQSLENKAARHDIETHTADNSLERTRERAKYSQRQKQVATDANYA